MTKSVLVVAAAAAVLLATVAPGAALPPVGFNVAPEVDAGSVVDETRLFCYNRMSGRFLHWGRCGGYRRIYSRPRIYCRNSYSGRFLHWGSCWR